MYLPMARAVAAVVRICISVSVIAGAIFLVGKVKDFQRTKIARVFCTGE